MGKLKITESLKPCPYCGQTDSLRIVTYKGENGFRDRYAVLCNYELGGCGAESGWRHYQEEAVCEWNRRSTDLVEALSALADMVNQFAYTTMYYGQEALQDGGLSALENAFWVLENAGCKMNKNGTIQRKNLFDFMRRLVDE